MRVCVLASGSSGNCIYISSGSTHILIDVGLSGKETERRLALLDVDPKAINGICVTHEHSDHTKGIRVMNKRHGIPLYGNSGTIENSGYKELPWNVFATGSVFEIGDLTVESFSIPHDAYDPVGFIVTHGEARVGVATDIGMPTQLIRSKISHCDALVLECNHDLQLLEQSSRPWHLKQRIKGRQGHLSNQTAAKLLSEIACERLRHVFLAHISGECNLHDRAYSEVTGELHIAGHDHITVSLTYSNKISDQWIFNAASVE
ncbi:MAG: MBL fold metallo-hydrolase [Spartobacteria bacterium]|nr:MBL fold metallo-hydrolase [Spartobacteria bacterium]